LVESNGFRSDELVRVTDQLRDFAGRPSEGSHAVVFFAPPFEFSLDGYALADEASGIQERLVPGSVLNAFPGAVRPEA
jgi:hypothetical protein